MITQDISSLPPGRLMLGPVAWAMGWRITLASVIAHLVVAIGGVTKQMAGALGVIDFALMLFIPYVVLAFTINRPFREYQLEIGHAEYGYLVQEHLTRGGVTDAGWAFTWRFLVVSLGLLVVFGTLELFFLASLYDVKTLLITAWRLEQVANLRTALILQVMPIAFFLPAILAANWQGAIMTLRWLVRHPQSKFAFVLVPVAEY